MLKNLCIKYLRWCNDRSTEIIPLEKRPTQIDPEDQLVLSEVYRKYKEKRKDT